MKKCPNCGKENVKRMDLHKINCPGTKTKEVPPVVESVPIAPPTEPVRAPISIMNIMDYAGGYEKIGENLMAWFEDEQGNRISKPLDYQGIFNNGNNQVPTVLVLTNDGTLLPPIMVDGFIGILPENFIFPVIDDMPEVPEEVMKPIESPDPQELQPPNEPTTDQMIERFKQKDNAVVSKLSIFDKLKNRNKYKHKQEQGSNQIDAETLALLKQIPVQGGK